MTNNDGWIEWKWTPEKPYPAELDTLVKIKCLSDGYEETDDYAPDKVSFWIDASNDLWEPDHYGSITHYKLVGGEE